MIEMKKELDGSILIDSDDLSAALAERPEKDSKVGGVDFYVPFRFKDNFSPGQFGSDQHRAAFAKSLKLKPKDVLAVLKHSPTTTEAGIVLKTTQRARDGVFRMMISAIANRHADLSISVVTHPQSSSEMALTLAFGVADKLGVELVDDIVRRKKSEELEIDEDRFGEFQQEALADGRGQAYVDKTRKDVEKLIAQWRKKSETPETKKLLHKWRKFIVLHTASNQIGHVKGKTVLVIDDNVDKAETFKGIEKVLRAAGATEVYNAAGWDYSSR